MSRDAHYVKMIQSQRWKNLRKQKLNANPLCECCSSQGLYTPAVEVHHRLPVESAISANEMSRLMFDYNNLEALCHACHVKRHKDLKSHSKAKIRDRITKTNARFYEKYLKD